MQNKGFNLNSNEGSGLGAQGHGWSQEGGGLALGGRLVLGPSWETDSDGTCPSTAQTTASPKLSPWVVLLGTHCPKVLQTQT